MMEKNEKELSKLLDKFCDPNAELSKEELHQIVFLLGDEQEDEYVNQLLQQDWNDDYTNFDQVNYDRISARIAQQMQANRNKPLSFMQFFYRCAAVLVLPLLGLSAYFMMQTIHLNRSEQIEIVEVLYAVGTPSRITLSDGSTVTLQDGSRLIQKNNFSGNTREVILEGEAFFDIAQNPNQPFIIHTGRIRTTALGTSFSIVAIPGETSITVAVAEGSVKVEDGRELLAILQANQQFAYGIEPEFPQENLADATMDWDFLELIFRNMLFGDIAQQLAVKHDVTITFRDKELKERRINVLLDSRNSIEELLVFLSASQGATVAIEADNYVIKNIE